MKRNVLHLLSNLSEGGSERQALQLARLLRADGRYKVHIACMDASGVLRDEAIEFGDIPEFPLTSFYDTNMARQLRRFAQFLRQRKIDIVHTHDFYSNVFGMPGAALGRASARIASRRETKGWRTGLQRFVERRSYSLAHSIVANSEAVRKQLISEGLQNEKIVTIYNSLDAERVRARSMFNGEEALAEMGLPVEAGHSFVTIVANLRHKVKNHAMFLRAARRVSHVCPQARFVIAGEGELADSTRELADQLGLKGKVYFIGRCNRVAELLALSSICVLSSTAEGFSNAILEYMAAARPVVATSVGGASEAIADSYSGYLVPSDDDAAMAERIILLLQNPERAKAMGERGREIVRERFSCEMQLQKTLELYDRLLAEPGPIKAMNTSSNMSLETQR